MKIPRLVRHSLLALVLLVVPASMFAGVVISVRIGPPPLPVYVQPPCPDDGYIWTPGYWAYGPDGYYWVPGTWVMAPEPGLLWTPGYWGWSEGLYVWHAGYWGPHVGFYGGINYGFGYFGTGYEGGYWHGRDFFYNRSVNNVTITNVHIYNRTVINHVNRVSYNGGEGGIHSRPTGDDERWGHERHFEPTAMQTQHENAARDNRDFRASVNHGHPGIAATGRPGDFHNGYTASRTAPMNRPVPRPENTHSMERPMPMNRPAPRPENARSMERPAPHQNSYNNHGGYRTEAPRPGNGHSNVAPHPTAYHVENGRQNPRPQGNAQRGGKEDRGHK